MHRLTKPGAVAGWRVSSTSRAALRAFVSRGQVELSPGLSELSVAVSAALALPEGTQLAQDYRRVIGSWASSEESGDLAFALQDLLAVVEARGVDGLRGSPVFRVELGSRVDSDTTSAVWLEDVSCSRCGLASYSGPEEDRGSCDYCGYQAAGMRDPGRDAAVSRVRDAAREGFSWVVGPTLYLLALSQSREEVLMRAGTSEERLADRAFVDDLDQRVDSVLRGPRAGQVLCVVRALASVVDLARSALGLDLAAQLCLVRGPTQPSSEA